MLKVLHCWGGLTYVCKPRKSDVAGIYYDAIFKLSFIFLIFILKKYFVLRFYEILLGINYLLKTFNENIRINSHSNTTYKEKVFLYLFTPRWQTQVGEARIYFRSQSIAQLKSASSVGYYVCLYVCFLKDICNFIYVTRIYLHVHAV